MAGNKPARERIWSVDVVSTLNAGVTVPGLRHCGNTTRQVDWAVQELYEGNAVNCQDHYRSGDDERANQNLFKLIRERLRLKDGDIRWERKGQYYYIALDFAYLENIRKLQKQR